MGLSSMSSRDILEKNIVLRVASADNAVILTKLVTFPSVGLFPHPWKKAVSYTPARVQLQREPRAQAQLPPNTSPSPRPKDSDSVDLRRSQGVHSCNGHPLAFPRRTPSLPPRKESFLFENLMGLHTIKMNTLLKSE